MRLVAFLRGINVGGHVVKMDALKKPFEALGFKGVETFIASGNVVFDSRAAASAPLERRIESKLEAALGYEVRTFLRTGAEVAAVARYQPFAEAELRKAHALYVGFFSEPLAAAAAKAVEALGTDADELQVHGRELYWLCGKSMNESKLSYSAFEKIVKSRATFRNVTTVSRLAAKFGFAVMLLVALPALALGQSMGDAAKKERERRDKLREAGASGRTVTDEELAGNKGSLANDPKAAPAKGSDGENAKGRASLPAARTASDPRGEDYWRRRVAQARGEVERAQRRHDAFQRMIRIGQPGEYDENGRRVIYSIYQMKQMADEAEAGLASAQKALENVLEDGRRSGALPGWLR